ncbi:unnamed protein product [Cylindrotheca closterium]|uniref:Uncharacterized protein n=1 Tax=Cylindrotheca closterium TaxID=2856 RepID=A0AAD2CAG3_9STRA|nr:unnamed protein product [Cylindrotheca closterium]
MMSSSSRLIVSTVWNHHRAAKAPSSSLVRLFSSKNNQSNDDSSSLFDSAGGYFNSLRWKAANALTASLPEAERNQLLERMEPKKESQNSQSSEREGPTVPERSIDEIIAATKAEEAAKYEKRWVNTKEQLQKEAEEAALKRAENDIALQKRKLAFEAWQKNLEREMESASAAATTPTNVTSVKEEVLARLGDHPILGPVLVDLGSKRLHLVTAEALAAVPVWKKQRTYRHQRAKEMANDKMTTLHLGLPGIVGIYESSDGNLSIIDGQHRIGMLRELKNRNPEGFDFEQILVEVYPQQEGMDETEHAQEFFSEVNKAQPVRLLDLPNMAKASHLKMINGAAKTIKEKYPDMFSESQRCRPPHLNEDNLRDAIFAASVIDRHSLKSPKQLQDWIMTQNEIMQAKLQEEEAQQKVNAKALEKATKFGFYLGLGNDWYYN